MMKNKLGGLGFAVFLLGNFSIAVAQNYCYGLFSSTTAFTKFQEQRELLVAELNFLAPQIKSNPAARDILLERLNTNADNMTKLANEMLDHAFPYGPRKDTKVSDLQISVQSLLSDLPIFIFLHDPITGQQSMTPSSISDEQVRMAIIEQVIAARSQTTSPKIDGFKVKSAPQTTPITLPSPSRPPQTIGFLSVPKQNDELVKHSKIPIWDLQTGRVVLARIKHNQDPSSRKIGFNNN